MLAAGPPQLTRLKALNNSVRNWSVCRMARKLDPPNPKFNQGLHLRPTLRDLRPGECPGNSTDQTGDAKIVDTALISGVPAVHD